MWRNTVTILTLRGQNIHGTIVCPSYKDGLMHVTAQRRNRALQRGVVADTARDLGVVIDSQLTLSANVSVLTRSC